MTSQTAAQDAFLMKQLVEKAKVNITEASEELFNLCSGSMLSVLISQGLLEVLLGILFLEANTSNAAEEDIVIEISAKIMRNQTINIASFPMFLNAVISRTLKNAKENVVSYSQDLLLSAIGDLVWSVRDDAQQERNLTSLAKAGVQKVAEELINKSHPEARRMISVLINVANCETAAPWMIRDNHHVWIMQIMKQTPKEYWEDDNEARDDYTPRGLFDVATNLCKWASIRQVLINSGYVDFLASLVSYENYYGFESTEGLAYIVGRSEDAKMSSLLKAKESNVQLIFDLLESSLNGYPSRYGITWSIYGRVLAIQSLSVSDANKPMMKPAIPLLIRVLSECPDDARSIYLCLVALLELCFDTEIKNMIMSTENLESTISTFFEHPESKIRKTSRNLAISLNFSSIKDIDFDGAKRPDSIVVSYTSNDRDIATRLVEELNKLGLDIWFDMEDGDSGKVTAVSVIPQSRVVIPLLSRSYKESSSCRLEIMNALKFNKPIVPVYLEEFKPDGWLGLTIGTIFGAKCLSPEKIPSTAPVVLNHVIQYTKQTSLALKRQSIKNSEKRESVKVFSSSPENSGTTTTVRTAASFFGLGSLEVSAGAEVRNMTLGEVQRYLTLRGMKNIAYLCKANAIDGKALAIIYDSYTFGNTNVINSCRNIGLKNLVDILDLLHLAREGKRFPGMEVSNMTSRNVYNWLFAIGYRSLGELLEIKHVNGKTLAIIMDFFARGRASVSLEILKDLGIKPILNRLRFLGCLQKLCMGEI